MPDMTEKLGAQNMAVVSVQLVILIHMMVRTQGVPTSSVARWCVECTERLQPQPL